MTHEFSFERKKLVQEFVEQEKKLIEKLTRQIAIIHENIEILCDLKEKIKFFEPRTGIYYDNPYMYGLYVTNDYEKIVADLQTNPLFGLPFGYFINQDGTRIVLFLEIYDRDVWGINQKFNAGDLAMKEGQETPNQKAYDLDSLDIFLSKLKLQDGFDGIEQYEMRAYTLALIENGFHYVLKENGTGERQYKYVKS